MPALSSVIEAIGNTPLVRLDRLVRARGLTGTILAKLDYLNPGFSKKDRAARGLIEEAEAQWQPRARPDGGGADLRQYGHGPCHCLRHTGLSLRGGDVERQFAGARAPDGGAGRRGGAGGPVAEFHSRRSFRRRSGAGGRGRAARLTRRTRRLPRRPIPSRGAGWRIITPPARRSGSRAGARSMPLPISPAPAAPMPASPAP